MENAEQASLRLWVAEQTAYLDPPAGWEPDTAAALAHWQARTASNPRPAERQWPFWAAAAALAAAAVLVLPGGRVMAQQFWQFLTVRPVAFIRVNRWPQGVPSPAVNLIGTPIPPIPARDIDQAGARVHYTPRMPGQFVFAGSPKISTTFSLSAGTVVKVADLALALQKAGVTGQTVPPEWEGAQLALHTSSLVIAEWPDVVLVQSLPLTLSTPANFDFAAYSALILQVLGVSPDQARQLAGEMGTAPPWLAPIAGDLHALDSMERVTLQSGPGTLVQQAGAPGTPAQVTLCWSVPDRVYLIHGSLTRELAIIAANSIR
jgi:hypothetical protein